MSPMVLKDRPPALSEKGARAGRWGALVGLGTIGYILAGYPLVITTWSRLKGEAAPVALSPRPISVVVSAHNEAGVIGPKLASIAGGDYPLDLLQVIVSDDGSTDGTSDVVREVAPWAEVVRVQTRTGKMGAMQRGMARVRHDIVVFTDAENILEPAALCELVIPFGDPTVGAVNGVYLPQGGGEAVSKGERLYWRYEDAIKRAEANVGSLTSIWGGLLAVRTELVPELPGHLINDDFYLGMNVARSGRRVAYASRAVTSENGAASLRGDAVRRARMTAGRWQTVLYWREILPVRSPKVMWQVVSHKYLRLILPLAMGVALAGSAAEVLARRTLGRPSALATTVLMTQLGGYLLAASADQIPPSLSSVRSAAQAARYLVRANAASAEGFWQFLTAPEQLALWERVEKVATAS